MSLGDVGDDDPPPQAENRVASVAPEAAWHAPAQNRRRETVFVFDIAEMLVKGRRVPDGRTWARSRPRANDAGFPVSAAPGGRLPITDPGSGPVIS
jgi:hypothetical protein